MFVPPKPKIYHIVHLDRLASIVADSQIWCDARMESRHGTGTTIGMSNIKQYRLTKALNSHPDLHVGDCVPFYFCPRSVMLYVIHRANNPELAYRGGQGPILHLEADMRQTIAWADTNNHRWAFTSSNAGSRYFEDYSDLARLEKIDWDAVQAMDWAQRKDGKQAEFLLESSFPWGLVSRIGIESQRVYGKVRDVLRGSRHRPTVEIKPGWYY